MSASDADSTRAGFVPAQGHDLDSTAAGFRISSTECSQPKTPPLSSIDSPESGNETDPMVGSQVGPFKIESIIASGGMGTVYKGWQENPVRRHVALKMIRHGMADASTMQRFMVERQTLALMDHPDIARVYEAGTTNSGNPYFAMEFCDGAPIDEFCDHRQLDIPGRIQLAMRIARAVQRAHSHGIIHRDLKPGNVLVSDCEGRPNLKVIDFGIAKFMDQEERSSALGLAAGGATRVGEMVGTPPT